MQTGHAGISRWAVHLKAGPGIINDINGRNKGKKPGWAGVEQGGEVE